MKQKTIYALLMLLFASILFFGCSKSKDSLALNADGSVRGSATTPTYYARTINIERNVFNPADVIVMQSGSVLWVNKDSQMHTVTANDGSFDSGDIQAGGSYSLAFNTVGLHPYYCRYHPEQSGLIRCLTK